MTGGKRLRVRVAWDGIGLRIWVEDLHWVGTRVRRQSGASSGQGQGRQACLLTRRDVGLVGRIDACCVIGMK